MDLKGKPFYLSEKEEKWVYNTLNKLTLEEKIHQMFCILGDAYSNEELLDLVKGGIGGVLFRPVRSLQETKNLYQKLDELSSLPLLHAANLEEGGAGIANDGTYFASELGVAASNNIDDVVNFAKVCAYEGIKAGVDWTFSPVSDIDLNFLNPITNCRTFGSDANRVKAFTSKFVEVYQSFGLAACAKHFPGDGVDFRDQHLHPTYNSLSSQEWFASYGSIYKAMIDEGLLSVMVGHICQPSIEKEYNPGIAFKDIMPASLSKTLLTNVLRERLNFNGLVCTDASIMGGYTMAMPRSVAIPTSFASGVDLIVFSTDIKEDFSFALDGVKNGILSQARVDECVTRILAMKALLSRKKIVQEIDGNKAARLCAKHAITLVKNNASYLPLNVKKYPRVRLTFLGDDNCYDGSVKQLAKNAFLSKGFDVEIYEPFKDDLHGTNKIEKDRINVTFLHYPPASNQTTVRVNWCAKHALEIPRFVNEEDYIFISLANPYHLMDIPRAKVFINAYSGTKNVIEEVVNKLCGESSFEGVSPVDPFCNLKDTKL